MVLHSPNVAMVATVQTQRATPTNSRIPLKDLDTNSAGGLDMDARKSTKPTLTTTMWATKPQLPAQSVPMAASASTTQQSFEVTPTNILLHQLPSNRFSLIDLSWSLTPITLISPPLPHSLPIRLLHSNTLHTVSLPLEILLSTPSDFHSIILSPTFLPSTTTPTVREEYIVSSLRSFGLEDEPNVKTILEYMHCGRFNSATYNPRGTYDFDRSVSLLGVASRYAMTRVIHLVLAEMTREFLPSDSHHSGTSSSPGLDLSATQLDDVSRIYDRHVHAWITTYIITLFKTDPVERVAAKKAVEECIANAPMSTAGGISEGSMLQRIVAKWFRENKNPSRGKMEGELSRLLMMRAKSSRLGSTGRGSSVATTRGESVLSTKPGGSLVGTGSAALGKKRGRPRKVKDDAISSPTLMSSQTPEVRVKPTRLKLIVRPQPPSHRQASQIVESGHEEQQQSALALIQDQAVPPPPPSSPSTTLTLTPNPVIKTRPTTKKSLPPNHQPQPPSIPPENPKPHTKNSKPNQNTDSTLRLTPDSQTLSKPQPKETDSEIDPDIERELKYDAEYNERIRKVRETSRLLLDHFPL